MVLLSPRIILSISIKLVRSMNPGLVIITVMVIRTRFVVRVVN